MSKKPFVIFGIVLVLLLVAVPFWVFRDGDPATARMEVPAKLEHGQELFRQNCGNCHTLYAAGTSGDFGPDLDQKLAPAGTPTGDNAADTIDSTRKQLLAVLEQGADSPDVPGRMPPGIVSGTVADQVAEFVAQTAGRG